MSEENKVVTVETSKGDGVDCPNYIRAFIHQQIKGVDAEKRGVTHLITTDSVDRQGDIVDPGGVDLGNYRHNPVVLVDHDYRMEKVVGRARTIEIGDESITATTEFRDTPLAMEAFALAREGLGGWSIGFRPKKRHFIRDGAEAGCSRCKSEWDRAARGKKPGDYVPGGYGLHFTEWELLEYSIVAIPANQDIVNDAIKRGLIGEDSARVFFRQVQSAGASPAKAAAQEPNVIVPKFNPLIAAGVRHAERRLKADRIAQGIERCLESLRHE